MFENNWRDLYRDAILELDVALLKIRLQIAEDAIKARTFDALVSREERKSATIGGFTGQVGRVLCNGCTTNGQPLSVHFFQSAYSGQCIIHLLPLFSRNKGIERTRLNRILGYLQANLE